MFCRFCGKSIEDDSLFCPYCGKPLESDSPQNQNDNSQPIMERKFPDIHDDAYYLHQASKIAGNTLISFTKVACYVALAVFLFLNLKMAPFYGMTKTIIYVIMAAIAIGFVVLFNKKVLSGKTKAKYVISLVVAIIVITSSVGLRIVYESKVASVTASFPQSGTVKVTMSTHTEYYNATGTGFIRNPSTHIRIDGKWYESGDAVEIVLGQKYDMRVGAGGSGNGGYTDTTISFSNSSFNNGKYTVTQEVRITSVPASLAEVQITFTRFCTFWEVIFG